MHLVELLLVLVTEGREALPKAPHAMGIKRTEGVLGSSSGGDRSHRQVIEAIRSGNNEEFFETMEAGMTGEEVGWSGEEVGMVRGEGRVVWGGGGYGSGRR